MKIFPYDFLLLVPLILVPLYFLTAIKNGKNGDQAIPNFPPGPPKLPIIGNLHQLIKQPHHQALSQLSNIYGPVMFVQYGRVPAVVISSAEAAAQVLKTLDTQFCSRIQLAGRKRLSYNYLDMALAPYGEYWREIRKICVVELCSRKRVQSFKVVVAEEIGVLIDSISSSSSNTTPLNALEMLTSFAHKTIYRFAFGSTTGQSSNRFDNGRLAEILCEVAVVTGLSASDFFPKISWIIDRITGLHSKTEKCFRNMDDFLQQIIDEHENPERVKPEHEDIIDVFLKLKIAETSTIRLTNDHIKAVLVNLYLGGVDSPAVIMNWAMIELVKNPKAMKKVQEEIRSYVGSKGKVEEPDLDNFLYLKMVVKETMRLHPIASFLLRETKKHTKIGCFDIYPKTWVLINTWALGRNPEYWQNPEEFLPERFKDSSIDFGGDQSFEYTPFGGGRRVCPAINMSIVLVEFVLANVLCTFNWELPEGLTREDLNKEELAGLGSRYPLELVPIKNVVRKSN